MAKFTISIHAPAKGATFFTHPYKACPTISIHAPAKGATSVGSVMDMFTGISIHAPAKGATDTSLKIYPKITISIHAPAKGATKVHQMFCADIMNFNPRSREGSDLILNSIFLFVTLFQSTLPRRERLIVLDLHSRFINFNPRSREGSDSNIIQQISFSLYNTVYFVSNNIK